MSPSSRSKTGSAKTNELRFSIFALATAALLCSSCSLVDPPRLGLGETATARIWQTAGKTDLDQLFPERSIPEVMAKPNFGFCISGGGNLSTTAGLGELRGLYHLGLLQKARYAGAVSGGSTAVAMYVYQRNIDDRTFLGRYVAPGDLRWEDFTRDRPEEFASALSRANLSPALLPLTELSDERFSKILGRIYLQPFGLGSPYSFTAYGERAVKDIRNRKGNEGLAHEQFHIAPYDKPYPVFHSTLVRLLYNRNDYQGRRLPFEITPNYSGVRRYFPPDTFFDHPIGGGYVESFAYDTRLICPLPGGTENPSTQLVQVRRLSEAGRRHAKYFSLSDMIAASGAIHAQKLPTLTNLVGPEFLHWSPQTLKPGSAEHRHMDGAGLDVTGILGLLARDVRDIVVFVNRLPYDPGDENRIEPAMRLMGVGNGRETRRQAKLIHVLDSENGSKIKAMSDALDCRFHERRPLVHYDSYNLRSNDYLGVAGGKQVNIAWFFLGPQQNVKKKHGEQLTNTNLEWIDALHPAIREGIFERRSQFKNFPTFKMAFENPPRAIDLDVEQVNALAHYMAYSVVSEKEGLRRHFGHVEGLW